MNPFGVRTKAVAVHPRILHVFLHEYKQLIKRRFSHPKLIHLAKIICFILKIIPMLFGVFRCTINVRQHVTIVGVGGGHALHLPAGSRVTDCKLRKRTQKNSALGIVGPVASIILKKKRVL